MKLNRNVNLLLLASPLLIASFASAATIITNDGFSANNLTLPGYNAGLGYATYGSNVAAATTSWTVAPGIAGITGTPDISLRWNGETGGNSGAGYDTYTSWASRTGTVQLDSGTRTGTGTPNFYITFIPGATSAVLINSFALDAWAGGTGTHRIDWSVTDTAGTSVFTNGSWSKDNTGGRDTINVAYTGNVGETLVLKLFIATTITTNDSLAIDNISFDQVPEPSASGLLALTGLGLAYRRRR